MGCIYRLENLLCFKASPSVVERPAAHPTARPTRPQQVHHPSQPPGAKENDAPPHGAPPLAHPKQRGEDGEYPFSDETCANRPGSLIQNVMLRMAQWPSRTPT